MPEPCPRCGDPDGDCLIAYAKATDWTSGKYGLSTVLTCRLGQIAQELKRLNEALEQARSSQPKYPDFDSLVVTCPHGAVWCGVCITEKTAWWGAQR